MERLVVVFLVLLLGEDSLAKKSRRSYGNQNGGKLSFFAIGDAGGYAYYPYFTKTLQNVATQMAKVIILFPPKNIFIHFESKIFFK